MVNRTSCCLNMDVSKSKESKNDTEIPRIGHAVDDSTVS